MIPQEDKIMLGV